ncbi:MAG: P-loop NTPase [Halobacteria archaeon]
MAAQLPGPNEGPHPVAPGEADRIIRNMAGVKHVLVVMSGKGGVGKSTVAAHLALGLALRGLRVGVVDADFHGPSIPKMLGADREKLAYVETASGPKIKPVFVPPNVEVISIAYMLQTYDTPVVWRGPIKMKAIRQFLEDVAWGELDCLIFDLPPGTGDEPLSIAQVLPRADGAVIVTTPQEISTQAVRKSVRFAELLHLPVLGVVENMSGSTCPHCGKPVDLFDPGGGERLAKDFGLPLLGRIPLLREVADGCDRGRPVLLSGGPASKAFEEMVESVLSRVRAKPPPGPAPAEPEPRTPGAAVSPEAVAKCIEALKPAVKAEGGGLDLLGVQGDVVTLRLDFSGAPAARVALLSSLEKTLKSRVPGVRAVVAA